MILPIRSPSRPCVWPLPSPWMPVRSSDWPNIGACLVPSCCVILPITGPSNFPGKKRSPIAGNVFAPGRDYIRREPIGVCVGIIPWNFPASMAFWKIAQAIIMGNSIVLKPATATPLTALIIAEAAKAAGIPKGVINILPGPGGELGKILCTHPDVDKIAFTGSTDSGTGDHENGLRYGQESDPGIGRQIGQYHPGRCRYGSGRRTVPLSGPFSTRARSANRGPACWSPPKSMMNSSTN